REGRRTQAADAARAIRAGSRQAGDTARGASGQAGDTARSASGQAGDTARSAAARSRQGRRAEAAGAEVAVATNRARPRGGARLDDYSEAASGRITGRR